MLDAERTRRVVRRIHHREEHVGDWRERFPLLSHLKSARDGRDEAKDVGGCAHAQLAESCVSELQELAERGILGELPLSLEDLHGKRFVRFRKTDVVELDLAESQTHRFFGDAHVVLPQFPVVGIHPREPFFVAPDGAVLAANRPLRVHARCHRILEHDNARHGQNVVRLECIEQRLGVCNYPRLSGVALEHRIGTREVQAELIFDVDDERIDLRGVRHRYELTHPLGALRGKAVHVEAAHNRGVGCRRHLGWSDGVRFGGRRRRRGGGFCWCDGRSSLAWRLRERGGSQQEEQSGVFHGL